MKSTKLAPFSFRVLNRLKESNPELLQKEKHWILAVSGGIDSMVLWDLVDSWKTRVQMKVSIAHVHHGLSEQSSVSEYRNRAQELVHQVSQERSQLLLTNEAEKVGLKDEDQLRTYRKNWLSRWQQEVKADVIVEAHHRDDLLETRLIRLIRGCSPRGLPAMQVWSGPTLRPLLEFPKTCILKYAEKANVKFVEDTSNQDPQFLRNWIRQDWLPRLNSYRPGAAETLSRSLQSVSEHLLLHDDRNLSDSSAIIDKGGQAGIDLSRWWTLVESHQLRDVARLMHSLGVHQFSLGQLKEVQKRLNAEQSSSVFHVAGIDWRINAGQVTGEVCN